MKYKNEIITVIIVFFVIVGALSLFLADSIDAEKKGVEAQTIDARRFPGVEIERIPWTHDPHQHLLHPTQVEVHANRIYVLDYAAMTLKAFTLEGRLVAEIGKGRGRAPGELTSVMDFFVRDGRVWVLDGKERRVSIFRTEGTYVRRFLIETDASPFRIAPANEYLVVGQLGVAQPELFLKVDTTGQVLNRFGNLKERFDVKNPLVLTGSLLSLGNHIVFGATYASYLHYFDERGNLLRTVRTIDELEYEGPSSTNQDGGQRFRSPASPVQYRKFSNYNDTLRINTFSKKSRLSLMDYYTDGGSYVKSVKLPHHVAVACSYGEYVITRRDTTITKYRLK